MTQPDNPPTPQGEHGTWPDPRRVRDQRGFREALRQLCKSQGMTYRKLVKASTDGRLSSTTAISTTLSKDALPNRGFVVSFLHACGLSETERQPWLTRWEELSAKAATSQEGNTPQDAEPADKNPSVPLTGQGGWRARLLGGRSRLRALAVAGTVLALVAGAGAWQLHQQDQERFKEQHCGTSNPSLVTGAGGECTGVSDGSDGSAVFGSDLKPVMTAIGGENQNVTGNGDYVTVAFLTPLTSKDANNLTVGQYVAELEGAYTAIEEENNKNSRPKIRLLVASMGSSEKHWERAVDQLLARRDADRLIAAVGMGLSQQETVEAARKLSKADLPMVGDLITADGFDATGAVDGKGPINGLARVALSNKDQLTAISKQLPSGPRTAALVSTSVTPNGTRDLYTESLSRGFRTIKNLKKHLDDTSDFKFDPAAGPAPSFPPSVRTSATPARPSTPSTTPPASNTCPTSSTRWPHGAATLSPSRSSPDPTRQHSIPKRKHSRTLTRRSRSCTPPSRALPNSTARTTPTEPSTTPSPRPSPLPITDSNSLANTSPAATGASSPTTPCSPLQPPCTMQPPTATRPACPTATPSGTSCTHCATTPSPAQAATSASTRMETAPTPIPSPPCTASARSVSPDAQAGQPR